MTSCHCHGVALRGDVSSGSSGQCHVTGNVSNHECSQAQHVCSKERMGKRKSEWTWPLETQHSGSRMG